MRLVVVVVLLMGSCILKAQKMVVKTLENPAVSFITINGNNCYALDLQTVDISRITVAAAIDGEYFEDLLVNVEQEGAAVWVNTGFQPNFTIPNDKLSAHKVISISLKISIPENLNVRVYGSSTNVGVRGQYADLKISLADGTCTLHGRGEQVEINTQSGNIEVFTTKAQILATTKYGEIKREPFATGDDQFTLKTVTGNINIRKTE